MVFGLHIFIVDHQNNEIRYVIEFKQRSNILFLESPKTKQKHNDVAYAHAFLNEKIAMHFTVLYRVKKIKNVKK